MKNFLRFYFLFSLITVVFSCSDDNDSEDSVAVEYEVTRYSNTTISDAIVPKVTYSRLVDDFQVSAYFQNNNLGVAEHLLALVAEDGINNPVVTTFSPSGAINSVYEHNPLNGEVVIENYVFNNNGITYYGKENEVTEISEQLSFEDFQMNSNNNIDLMIREALDNNLLILENFNYEFNNDSLNRQTAGFAHIASFFTMLYLIKLLQKLFDSDKVKKSEKDISEACDINLERSYNSRNNQSSSFLCSELQELIDHVEENSGLEVGICNGLLCILTQVELSGNWYFDDNPIGACFALDQSPVLVTFNPDGTLIYYADCSCTGTYSYDGSILNFSVPSPIGAAVYGLTPSGSNFINGNGFGCTNNSLGLYSQ